MAYLAQWRLKTGGGDSCSHPVTASRKLAGDGGLWLRSGIPTPVQREFACPPAQFRRKRKATPAQL